MQFASCELFIEYKNWKLLTVFVQCVLKTEYKTDHNLKLLCQNFPSMFKQQIELKKIELSKTYRFFVVMSMLNFSMEALK